MTVALVTFVSTFTAFTSALGITAPVASFTTPEMEPLTAAHADAAAINRRGNTRSLERRIMHLTKVLLYDRST